MEYALGRLPWLCPPWTDHNAHDPGVTILELIAWYKEMQQYHMNVVTDALQRKLLKLLGVRPALPAAARCLLRLAAGDGQDRPALSRLENPHGVCFELLEPAKTGAVVESVYLIGKSVLDMTEVLRQKEISLWPFRSEQGETTLAIGLSGCEKTVRLWFEVDAARDVQRNPFEDAAQAPRTIRWSCSGTDEPPVVHDETHCLSESGFLTFEFPEGFGPGGTEWGLPEGNYLFAEQTDGGCEEEIRLCAVEAGCFHAAQQETWARAQWLFAAEDAGQVLLEDAVSREGGVYLFARQAEGLAFLESRQTLTEAGLLAEFDGSACAQDGKPNLLCVSQDALRAGRMLYAASGLPDMQLELELGGRQVLPQTLLLVCDTRCTDGSVRPALWHYVEELSACGPRDRAFSYDPIREQLVFGNGEHGAVPPQSERGILIASMTLSLCAGGNVPADCGMVFSDGTAVSNTAAGGGRAAQSTQSAAAEFLRSLKNTKKCASAGDYERLALETPGLRIAAAKAIAGFDPDEPAGRPRIPTVTLVALPWSRRLRPMPDERFLAAVRRYLERFRPVGTAVKVTAPRYVPVGISLQVWGDGADLEQHIRAAAESYLRVSAAGRAIGDPVEKDGLLEALTALDGVFRIDRLELRALGPDCYADSRGDLQVRKDAVAYLSRLDVQRR